MTAMPAANIVSQMKNWRRDFHAHPELGFEEYRTSDRVAQLLEEFGLEVHTGIGKTGVVGVLQRGNGTACIGLRADMDALPIKESNVFLHRSTVDGIMHACGHDGHTAMLLGAAKHLAQAGQFSGRVVFIFQPAEEHGKGGPAMLKDGLLDRFPIDEVYALHNMPGLEVGRFATRVGTIMASEALFEIEIMAKGGHSAMPHMGVDAISVGAELVGALQTIVSRKLDPGCNGVVSVTGFETDGKRNVLAGRCVLTGDARALTREANEKIEQAMRVLAMGISQAHGVHSNVSYETIFKATINASEPVRRAVDTAVGLVGAANVNSSCAPVLASEDFAHFAAERPACFLFTGNGLDGPNGSPLHSSGYDFNDDALVHGASFWINMVEQSLGPQDA